MQETLTYVAAIATGLMAGVFFAFSTFVMTGLKRAKHPHGMIAMQEINLAAPSPLFMLGLFGTGIVCAVLGVASLGSLDESVGVLRLVGSAVYIVSAIVLTGAYHIPRNNALAAVEPNDPTAAATWTRYAREWTAANHVRTIGPLASSILLTIAVGMD
jgi:uncharacterized membrane protein